MPMESGSVTIEYMCNHYLSILLLHHNAFERKHVLPTITFKKLTCSSSVPCFFFLSFCTHSFSENLAENSRKVNNLHTRTLTLTWLEYNAQL